MCPRKLCAPFRFKPMDFTLGACSVLGLLMQANYFFRLSKYQKEIEALLTQQAGFVRPESRRNEVLDKFGRI